MEKNSAPDAVSNLRIARLIITLYHIPQITQRDISPLLNLHLCLRLLLIIPPFNLCQRQRDISPQLNLRLLRRDISPPFNLCQRLRDISPQLNLRLLRRDISPQLNLRLRLRLIIPPFNLCQRLRLINQLLRLRLLRRYTSPRPNPLLLRQVTHLQHPRNTPQRQLVTNPKRNPREHRRVITPGQIAVKLNQAFSKS